MKKTLFAAILLLLPLASRAQHFEWAKGFGGSTQGNGDCLIKGSVTDDEGNLYILGQFNVNDTWNNGPRLIPMAPYGPGHMTVNALIAKISPSGEMLWKKVIHSNNGCHTDVHDIKKVGDTAFACLTSLALPVQSTNYCYYLDTLITTWEDYPIQRVSGQTGCNLTALIFFDFNGEITEQHFIQTSLVDSAGNDDITISASPYFPNWLNTHRLMYPTFDIDSEGNIYLARQANDNNRDLQITQGNIMGVKFWVDNRCVGMAYTNGKQQPWFPQILKFSPHFDTLLADRYVIQKSDCMFYPYVTYNLKLDNHDNVYYLCSPQQNGQIIDTIIVDSLHKMSFVFDNNYSGSTGFLVRYNSNLSAQWLIHLEDSIINPNIANSTLAFYDITFDSDSNLLFLSAHTGRGTFNDTTNFFSILTYRGIPLKLKNDAFFMSFINGANQPVLHSYGRVDAIMHSFFKYSSFLGTHDSKNNRIFLQSQNIGGIRYPDTIIRYPHTSDWGIGLTVFDYGGNVIEGQDYNTISQSNAPGPLCLKDSNLYLMQCLTTDATFGDIHVPVTESGELACVAKYVDPAFMTPYVYTGDTGDVRIALTPDVGAFTSYPNPFRQRVWIRVENATLLSDGGSPTALLTDLQGRQETVRLEPQGDGRYLLDLSSRPQASYVLTLTTADGHQHSLTLLSQHDRFGN